VIPLAREAKKPAWCRLFLCLALGRHRLRRICPYALTSQWIHEV